MGKELYTMQLFTSFEQCHVSCSQEDVEICCCHHPDKLFFLISLQRIWRDERKRFTLWQHKGKTTNLKVMCCQKLSQRMLQKEGGWFWKNNCFNSFRTHNGFKPPQHHGRLKQVAIGKNTIAIKNSSNIILGWNGVFTSIFHRKKTKYVNNLHLINNNIQKKCNLNWLHYQNL